ncbi:MAG: hypothetical protein KDD33_03505 [Bdellovibrionales bacterium]|nr:hypothetical protein [Bdellovibrionales bacterium]
MTKKLLGAVALSGLFLCSAAQAVDVWEGTKYIYSTSHQLEYAIKVELGQNQKGLLVAKEGSSSVSYQKVGETIEVIPLGTIGSIGYAFKVIEETGEGMQVQMVSKLKKMIISGDNDVVNVKETWESCYEYPVNGQTFKKCETLDTTMDEEVVLKDQLQSVGIAIQVNDNVVLPFLENDSVFINLESNKTVSVLAAGKAFDGLTATSWESDGNRFVLTLGDGATITYTATQNMDGVDRVVGLYKNGSDELTIVGALAIDDKIDSSSFSKSDIEGKYKTVLASTNTNQDTLYTFGADGLGGFEYSYLGQIGEVVWSWDLINGVIKATRYLNQDGIPAQSRDDVEACMVAGSNCSIYQTRTYKIISKTGNRYTMLRTLNHETGSDEYRDLSVWVFYKR